MKLMVHDFCGYRFTLQLGNWLADRYPGTSYVFNADYPGPVAMLEASEYVHGSLQVCPLRTTRRKKAGSLVARASSEIVYAQRLFAALKEIRPDVVLSANTPSLVQYQLHRWCARNHVQLVPWVQDLYGYAAAELLTARIPVFGSWIGGLFRSMDSAVFRKAPGVVAIADSFREELIASGCAEQRLSIVPNWAPLEAISVTARDNAWAQTQAFPNKALRVIYAGTLGMKHNPRLLSELARYLDSEKNRFGGEVPQVIVVSEGAGADWLREEKTQRGINNLILLPFQPDTVYESVLGAADILLAVLEPSASRFSVPSKILSYLCAGRPVIGSMPSENPASATIRQAGAGLITDPGQDAAFFRCVSQLLSDEGERIRMGKAARAYAENTFSIDSVGARFQKILAGVETAPAN
jgi:colanic acid biosynthesis glycosyl transferase WcaI